MFPNVHAFVDCKYYSGWTDVVKAPLQFADVLIGNVDGVIDNPSPNNLTSQAKVSAVTTRASSKLKPLHPIIVPSMHPIDVSPDKFEQLQQDCETLKDVRRQSDAKEETTSRDETRYQFIRRINLVYRKCISSKHTRLIRRCVLVVPVQRRRTVLVTAHESDVLAP